MYSGFRSWDRAGRRACALGPLLACAHAGMESTRKVLEVVVLVAVCVVL